VNEFYFVFSWVQAKVRGVRLIYDIYTLLRLTIALRLEERSCSNLLWINNCVGLGTRTNKLLTCSSVRSFVLSSMIAWISACFLSVNSKALNTDYSNTSTKNAAHSRDRKWAIHAYLQITQTIQYKHLPILTLAFSSLFSTHSLITGSTMMSSTWLNPELI